MPNASDFALDRRSVRRAFERAAPAYDSTAFLQREVAERMLYRLDYMKLAPARILDAGCGTGHSVRKLAARYCEASIVALDFAENMLHAARDHSPRWKQWWKPSLPLLGGRLSSYVCGDMEQLPLSASSIGLVWSNLALQWCDLGRCVAEAHRVLEPNGLIMFTTLGPDTLKELRDACAELDHYQHVNRFIDMHDVGDALVQAGFADPVMDMEIITITFDDMAAIMRDLKSLGARNHSTARPPGLTTPRRWQRVTDRYESFRQAGKLPVTVEVVYGHAWKVPPKSTSDGRQIIRFREHP